MKPLSEQILDMYAGSKLTPENKRILAEWAQILAEWEQSLAAGQQRIADGLGGGSTPGAESGATDKNPQFPGGST